MCLQMSKYKILSNDSINVQGGGEFFVALAEYSDIKMYRLDMIVGSQKVGMLMCACFVCLFYVFYFCNFNVTVFKPSCTGNV